MTQDELGQAIEQTQLKIYQVNMQLSRKIDRREEKRLQREINELQIKQVWYLSQLEW